MSILACFFLALIPSAASLTFNFPNISQNNSQDIILSGDAYTSDDGIEVTYNRNIGRSSEWLAGRVTYGRRLHLWDKDSTDLAIFSTSFTFVMASYLDNFYGDGLTFFLAQNNSVINAGGSIGLPFNFTTDTSVYPFVAVEFDSYGANSWDPKDLDTGNFIDDHVGININSITSSVSRKWFTNMTYGEEYGALINYHSDSKNLSVSFTSFKNNSLVWETRLDYTIDLRDVLPEWVIFGFSASTGDRYQKSNVRSWIFNSTVLKVDENNRLAPTISPTSPNQSSSLPPTTSTNAVKGKKKTWLMVGLLAGTPVLVTVVAILLYLIWRKKNNGDKVEELGYALEMNGEFEMGATMPRRFSYLELARSTAHFAETEKLGEGGFGGVYKEWVWELYGSGTLLKAVDPLLGSDFVEEEVKRLIILGLWCVHTDSEFRPSIRQVIKVLNSEASLPLLPSKIPMASYFATPTSSPSDFSPLVQYQSSSSTS
ncbi:hypothetical protein L1987_87131 [Smallanthus sonchifolius]|nr:hypothetical protein L1987_87131 [Smallanthus sonchifolius]